MGYPPWLGSKNLISRTSKMAVSLLRGFVMFKKINIRRKSKSSQWLILFRKIRPLKYGPVQPRKIWPCALLTWS